MELRHLRYFVAVAEELHFGRAAERLMIAQPPLSYQIKQLEAELGTRLFERTQRRVELTEAGRVFLEGAREVLNRADVAVHAAQRAGNGQFGKLTVGFTNLALIELLPETLPQFRRLFPDVEVVLQLMSNGEQATALREHQIEVGCLCPPVPDDGLRVETVLRGPVVAVLPPGHPLSRLRRVPLASLGGEHFVFFRRQPRIGCAAQLLAICLRAGFEPKVVQEADEVEAIMSMVSAGLGVSVLPAAVRKLRRAGVVLRPVEETAGTVELAVACREGEQSTTVRNFLELVRAAGASHSKQQT